MTDSVLLVAVLLACLLSFLTKLAGHLVPPRLLLGPLSSRALTLLPVCLLAGLVAVQAFAAPGGHLVLDARVAGLAAAVVALLLRAPFLVVILVAAAVAAGLRALGWAA
ncbi:AzlD domain-containing protein [Angustibacter sp. McL0619]|uniref:AzlD domain-containing protein n=1 Tax=Angustibacter sp. McL0619 TaxID=3415676 RepID=UPI003CEEB064